DLRRAVVVAGDEVPLRRAAELVVEKLEKHTFRVLTRRGRTLPNSLDDIELLESLLAAELCVFLLGKRVSYAHVVLAMAHAHCIPTVRLRHDAAATGVETPVSGEIRWNTVEDLAGQLEKQLDSFRRGVVRPVELARSSDPRQAAIAVATMQWES